MWQKILLLYSHVLLNVLITANGVINNPTHKSAMVIEPRKILLIFRKLSVQASTSNVMVFVDTIAIVNTIVITLSSLKGIANEFTLTIFPHHGIACTLCFQMDSHLRVIGIHSSTCIYGSQIISL